MKPDGRGDGRNIDPRAGILEGEGSHQRVRRLEAESPVPVSQASAGALARTDSTSDLETYYDLPLLKAPVWEGAVPLYFFVGGAAGVSAVLGAAALLSGDRRLRGLVRRSRALALGGAAVSAALLVEDLGRPTRFLYMLRVFRPTSPMSVGSWVLSAFGAAASAAALLPRVAPRAADAGLLAAGALGLPLCGYTAVLLANTAVPSWQGARHTLPFLFVASAAASAEALLAPLASGPVEERVLRRFGLAAQAAELLAFRAVEAELGRAPGGRPLRAQTTGLAGALWRTAQLCTVASLVLACLPGQRRARHARRRQLAASLLGCVGGILTRFAVVGSARASTRDPRATTQPQRLGLASAPAAI